MKVTRLFVGANVVAAGDVECMQRVVNMLRTRY